MRQNCSCRPLRYSRFSICASLREGKMTIIFQFALISLVLTSFVLVVGVPVAYATPQNWVESKKLLWLGSGVWIALVLLVGVLNFFVV
jgi:photosystem II PsbZ protein